VPLADVAQARKRLGKGILNLQGSGKGLWGKNSGGAIAQLRDEWA